MTALRKQGRLPEGVPVAATPSRRTYRILEAARHGLGYEEIGRRFGVTGSRIRQIARRWGVPPRQPVERISVRCQSCGKVITTPVTVPRKFCSKRCFYHNRRGRRRLPADPRARALYLAARRRVCSCCRKEFLAKFPGQRRPFCSRRCAGRARSKLGDGDLRFIKLALRRNLTYHEIASRLKVSRQYIHSLARGWNLTRRKR